MTSSFLGLCYFFVIVLCENQEGVYDTPKRPNRPIILREDDKFYLDWLRSERTPIQGYIIEAHIGGKWSRIDKLANKRKIDSKGQWERVELNEDMVKNNTTFRVISYNSQGKSPPSLPSLEFKEDTVGNVIEDYVPKRPALYKTENGSVVVIVSIPKEYRNSDNVLVVKFKHKSEVNWTEVAKELDQVDKKGNTAVIIDKKQLKEALQIKFKLRNVEYESSKFSKMIEIRIDEQESLESLVDKANEVSKSNSSSKINKEGIDNLIKKLTREIKKELEE